MRIFYALFRRRHMPNGHIFRGKDKFIKPVTEQEFLQLKQDFEIEERNMFLLRNPFLTPAQSHGHANALGKQEDRFLKLLTKKKDFYNDVTLESRLGHLRYRESWD